MAAELQTVSVDGVSLRVAIEGKGPLVLMVHGFPESWYSWRHQMQPLASAGYTACAIDVLGYGGSDKPHAVEAYAMEELTGQVAKLAALLSPKEPVTLLGHDWGAPIVWATSLVHPDRVKAVAALSVPYSGIPKRSLRDIIEENFTSKGRFFYQQYFAAEGTAEAEFEADPRATLRRIYYAWSGNIPADSIPRDKKLGDTMLHRLPDPDPFPSWLTASDLDYYVNEFTQSGFRGPLNRYRNHDRDFRFMQKFLGRKIEQPALFIAGERDGVLSMFGDRLSLMKNEVPNLQGIHLLPGCGHWTQQERPDEVNKLLLAWLGELRT